MRARWGVLAPALTLALLAPMPAVDAVRAAHQTAPVSARVSARASSHSGARFSAGHSAWVAVSVARLWLSLSSPRPVDAPAVAAPVRFRAWLHAMSLGQRRALFSYSNTEALLGERVVVRRVSDGWAKVVVPDQPSQKDSGGYPGWIPLRQLSATAPADAAWVATVVRRTAWLRSATGTATRVTEISAGTTLPLLARSGSYLSVQTPLGPSRRLAAVAAVVHRAGTPALAPHRGVLTTAKTFRGVAYLWGGLSGFGLDCSGLTWLSNRLHGTLIPRDSLPQSRHGQRVARSQLRRGDLIFYATRGLVHHVTMYAGHGRMIESPHTGAVVHIDRVRGAGYYGARRY